VRVASRELPRAQAVCQKLTNQVPDGAFQPVATPTPEDAPATLAGCGLVVAAGAAGAQLLHASAWQGVPGLSVAIDLNAVPPAGIEGIEAGDAAVDRHRTICYSALGVGGLKMKIHKAAIARLFLDNNQVLDAPEIFDVGRRLGAETRP
jgi:hypothetical protein